jgi:hypothetical protein
MLFFQSISWLDHDKFQEQLRTVDQEFEVKALGSQIYHLSKRVNAKHKAVNYGFVFAGASLVFFLVVGISYVARIQVVPFSNTEVAPNSRMLPTADTPVLK